MRLPYTPVPGLSGIMMPRLSFALHYNDRVTHVTGLLDTGAALNVLPHSVGLELGAVWQAQLTEVPLVGGFGRKEGRGLVLNMTHPELVPASPVRLLFSWCEDDSVPLVLGQTNFFMEFDVCFYRSQGEFEIHQRG
jgi:hypothetical protein